MVFLGKGLGGGGARGPEKERRSDRPLGPPSGDLGGEVTQWPQPSTGALAEVIKRLPKQNPLCSLFALLLIFLLYAYFRKNRRLREVSVRISCPYRVPGHVY